MSVLSTGLRRGLGRWLGRFLAGQMALASIGVSVAGEIDFQRDVAPILTKHCIRCHHDSKEEGGINLTRSALAVGEDRAILPGDPERSLLLDVITGDKPRMPQSSPPLSLHEQQTLRSWIEQGAIWPQDAVLRFDPLDWWSLQPLEKPPVPRLPIDPPNGAMPIRNPIDAFVVQLWRERGLHGSPEADRRTLIRRLYFDLIGLPPTPEAVEAFCSDNHPEAYEQLVEQLLESPRYGERWARHWLDAVHYGDTHGYDKDKLRPNAWPYRDYVIRSLNQDKPYSQFVREQIAGDHFFPDSRDGNEALGMLAAGPFDFVGQIEVANGTVEKARVKNIDRDDMVATVINTFVSLTAQCARCHDHKFDPITQREYYQLQAVFAAIDRADRDYDIDPEVASQRRELADRRTQLQSQRAAFEETLRDRGGEALASIDRQIATLQKPAQGIPPEFGYHSQIVDSPSQIKWVQIDLGRPFALKRIGLAAPSDDFAGIGPGFGFPVRFRIDASNQPTFQEDVHPIYDTGDSDRPNPGIVPQWFDANGIVARYVRVTATQLAERKRDFIFALSELIAIDASDENVALGAAVQAFDSIEAPVRWRATNLVDGIYPGRDASELEPQLRALQDKRIATIRSVLGVVWLEQYQALNDAIGDVDTKLARLPSRQRVYAATTEFSPAGNFVPTHGTPRPIHVLSRGSETAPMDLATPDALHCIPGLNRDWPVPIEAPERQHRAALADWIVDRNNPLAWRSIVNRVWYHHFGRGIVESLNDFGRMGAEPTHPELLDWLACEFRDGNQSLKDLHRAIVTSSTYRQASLHSESQSAIDAGNQYLWRMNRRKLDAEAIRDSVLAISGKLRLESGGPGFALFGLIDDHSPHYLYEQYDPDDPKSHRRAIYRFIVRSVPDPWMTALDCADAAILVDRRNETLTALQALAMLNNRFMLRMSEHFASRITTEAGDPNTLWKTAFRAAFQRDPNPRESDILERLHREAGLPQVCRSLFNANEFVFID